MNKVLKLILGLLILCIILTIEPQRMNLENWISVADYGSDSKAIQIALDTAKENGSANIYIPNGDYDIYETLVIYKNTHLLMEENARLIRQHSGTFIRNGNIGDEYYGYQGNGNIIIEGGILDGNSRVAPYGKYGYAGLGIAHADNVIIKNLTIKDIVYSHAIEINSSKNVIISNNKFLGYLDSTGKGARNYSEAIQLDSAFKSGFPAFGAWDLTPSKDVIIKNNFFGNSDTEGMNPWPVGVGGHGALKNVVIENVKIQNNTFDGMSYAGVRPYKWKGVKIQDNTFINNKALIIVNNSPGEDEGFSNIEISGNKVR
ncbi:MAG: right-handed parallel beta-helix repeat-containing protein [Bacillota bacterium]